LHLEGCSQNHDSTSNNENTIAALLHGVDLDMALGLYATMTPPIIAKTPARRSKTLADFGSQHNHIVKAKYLSLFCFLEREMCLLEDILQQAQAVCVNFTLPQYHQARFGAQACGAPC